jgi:hypothetical protein
MDLGESWRVLGTSTSREVWGLEEVFRSRRGVVHNIGEQPAREFGEHRGVALEFNRDWAEGATKACRCSSPRWSNNDLRRASLGDHPQIPDHAQQHRPEPETSSDAGDQPEREPTRRRKNKKRKKARGVRKPTKNSR